MTADNEYLVARKASTPPPRVEVFRGKHAVKTSRFFTEIEQLQAESMQRDWCYRPLKVEVEITDGCNQGCRHCGMDSKPMASCSDLPGDILQSLPAQLEGLGIPGISITGGEPFTAMRSLLDLVERCRGRVDLVKLTTNACWADSVHSAEACLEQLGHRGLVETRYFRPVLMISIGEQRVPLVNVVNAIVAARRLYDVNSLALCVSSLSLRGGEDRLSELAACYKGEVGKEFPWDEVFLTKRTYVAAGRAASDVELPRKRTPIREMCRERGCFRQTIGAVVLPTPLVKANGRVFTCAVFGMPEELMLGSLCNMTFKELLEVANSRPVVRALSNGNLPALMACARPEDLDRITVSHFHEACWRLVELTNRKGPDGRPAPQ